MTGRVASSRSSMMAMASRSALPPGERRRATKASCASQRPAAPHPGARDAAGGQETARLCPGEGKALPAATMQQVGILKDRYQREAALDVRRLLAGLRGPGGLHGRQRHVVDMRIAARGPCSLLRHLAPKRLPCPGAMAGCRRRGRAGQDLLPPAVAHQSAKWHLLSLAPCVTQSRRQRRSGRGRRSRRDAC